MDAAATICPPLSLRSLATGGRFYGMLYAVRIKITLFIMLDAWKWLAYLFHYNCFQNYVRFQEILISAY